MSREVHFRTQANDVSFQQAYVDCPNYQSDAKASREMARKLAASLDVDIDVPRVGIGAADYRDIIWDLLEEYNINSLAVILDEINKLDDDELLRSLSRARESGKAETHVQC